MSGSHDRLPAAPAAVLSPTRILVAAIAAQAAFSFLEQGLPTLTVFVKDDLELSAAGAGSLVAAMGIGRLMGFYAAGRTVDRRGEQTVLVAGAVGAGVFMAIAAGLPFAAMLGALFVAGLFLATASPAGSKLVFTAFPLHRRDFAMGLRQASVPLGGLVAAAALPLLAHASGWRASFVLAGVVSVIGGLVAFALAGRGSPSRDRVHPARRPIRSFFTRNFTLWVIWSTIMVCAQYVLLTFFAVDVRERAGVSAATAALMLLVTQGTGLVVRVVWGWLADRYPRHRRRGFPLGMTIGACLATAVLAAVPTTGLLGFALIGAAMSLSINAWQGIWQTRLTEMSGLEHAGTGNGIALTFMALGWTVGTPLFGYVADASGSFRVMWAVLAGSLLAGAFALMAMRFDEAQASAPR